MRPTANMVQTISFSQVRWRLNWLASKWTGRPPVRLGERGTKRGLAEGIHHANHRSIRQRVLSSGRRRGCCWQAYVVECIEHSTATRGHDYSVSVCNKVCAAAVVDEYWCVAASTAATHNNNEAFEGRTDPARRAQPYPVRNDIHVAREGVPRQICACWDLRGAARKGQFLPRSRYLSAPGGFIRRAIVPLAS